MTDQHTQLPIDILLVEDCSQQIQHVRHALTLGKFVNRLHTVGDSIEAIAYLRRHEPYQEAPTPSLILLDIDSPQQEGLDVLDAVKNDPVLRQIPVVVLTDNAANGMPFDHQSLSANYYIGKPFDLPQFIDAIQWIESISLVAVHTNTQMGTRPRSNVN